MSEPVYTEIRTPERAIRELEATVVDLKDRVERLERASRMMWKHTGLDYFEDTYGVQEKRPGYTGT